MPTSTPIHQTATFAQPGAGLDGPFDYSRTDNPTRRVLEEQLARLDGGARALAYSSGMAAIAGVLELVRPGQELCCDRDLYGGTQRLFGRVLERRGARVRVVDAGDPRALASALSSRTAIVWLESPTNPLLRVLDLEAVAAAAHRAGALCVVDGTLMSPWLQRPLERGADMVVHSATKHLAGHGDATAGVAVTRDAALGEELGFLRNATGAALAPFEAWLLLRGMKTLGVRLDRAQATAGALAEGLAAHRS